MKDGDTVQLKSGGPVMTIMWIEGGQAYCQWFDGKKIAGERLSLVALKPAKPKDDE